MLQTTIYRKQTDRQNYFDTQSEHLKLLKNSISYKQDLRIKRICSSQQEFRYYATFKVRKFESLSYKINTCLQKNYHLHWIAGRGNILSKYIIYIFFSFGRGFCGSFPELLPKSPVSCCKKKFELIFVALYYLH